MKTATQNLHAISKRECSPWVQRADGLHPWHLAADMHNLHFRSFTENCTRESIIIYSLLQEVIGKGSYGVVCSAVDSKTGEKVAIKKINNVFDHVSDATRILREIKLLRLLRHPGG